MRPALALLALLYVLGGAQANTCKAVSTMSSSADAADSTSSSAVGEDALADNGSISAGVSVTSAGVTLASASGDASSAAGSAATTSSAASGSTSESTSAAATSSADGVQGSQMGTDLILDDPSDDCSCGYKVSSLDDQYFPYRFSFQFSSLSDGDSSSLDETDWVINDGDYVGGAADGNRCWGSKDNIAIDSGDLVLTMPGGQTASSEMSCAEIAFDITNLTGGIFQTNAMLSGVDGTCQAFWLNHSIATEYADEVDIEVISSSIDTDGIYYTNWPPNGDPNDPDSLTSVYTTVAFPDLTTNDPRTTYNNYTIAWLDDTTTRYYNGEKQDSPTANQPEHNMTFVINNWSNGGSGWTLGPPTDDSELKVKSVLLYYKTAAVDDMAGLDSSCTESEVCSV